MESTPPEDKRDHRLTDYSSWKGLDARSAIELDFTKIEQLVASLCDQMSAHHFDGVVGLARAGVVPGVMFSQKLGAEFYALRAQRHCEKVEWLCDPPPSGAKLLVIDDIVSRGGSMKKALDALVGQGFDVKSAALFVDVDQVIYPPDFAFPTRSFVRFAWDRRESVPASKQWIAAQGSLKPSKESEFFGVVLDGILIPDIPQHEYEADMEGALARRNGMPPNPPSAWPALDWSKACIVSARPKCDFSVTREWLDRHGLSNVPLRCRDTGKYPFGIDGAVAHKVEAISSLGVSTFIESDLIQAVLIANACPTVDVIWWGPQHQLRIGGVSQSGLVHPRRE